MNDMDGTRWFVGVDLGQAQDYTAIAVVEKLRESADSLAGKVSSAGAAGRPVLGSRGALEAVDTLHVRHLERLPLGTSYLDQATYIATLCNSPELKEVRTVRETHSGLPFPHTKEVPPEIAVDTTGVGRAVRDLLRAQGLEFQSITIHGGDAITSRGVPKREIIQTLQVALELGWLKIASGLEHAETLRRELLNYRIKVNPKTAHDSYDAWREKDHDDLVLAVAMACYASAKRSRRPTLTGSFRGW